MQTLSSTSYIILGVVLGVAVLVLLIVILVIRVRRRRLARAPRKSTMYGRPSNADVLEDIIEIHGHKSIHGDTMDTRSSRPSMPARKSTHAVIQLFVGANTMFI